MEGEDSCLPEQEMVLCLRQEYALQTSDDSRVGDNTPRKIKDEQLGLFAESDIVHTDAPRKIKDEQLGLFVESDIVHTDAPRKIEDEQLSLFVESDIVDTDAPRKIKDEQLNLSVESDIVNTDLNHNKARKLATQQRFVSVSKQHVLSLTWRVTWPRVLLVLCLVGHCSGSGLIPTNQELPPDCLKWFTDVPKDCPIKAERDLPWNKWSSLNNTCCSNFPNTHLHCQRNGSTNFPACLPDKPVPKGHYGRLVKDEEGNPQFEIVPCDSSSTYQAYETVSSNNTYPDCVGVKTKCEGKGLKLWCHGGTVTDDMCTCATGYRVAVGYDKVSTGNIFICEPFSCPEGQAPVPVVAQTQLCTDVTERGSLTNDSCISNIPAVTPLPKYTSESPNTVEELENVTRSIPNSSLDGRDSTGFETDTQVRCFRALKFCGLVVFFALLLILAWFTRCGNQRCYYRPL